MIIKGIIQSIIILVVSWGIFLLFVSITDSR